jgi:ribosomal protein L37AE/L43A
VKITVGELKKLLREAKGELIPAELSALIRGLPEFKLQKTASGWVGTIKITEKRSKEQTAFSKAWDKLQKQITSKPWSLVQRDREGWDSNYDTGGNFSRDKQKFIHPSGIMVQLSDAVSFNTGTKTWTLIANQDSLASESFLREADEADENDSFCPKCGTERYKSASFMGWDPCPKCNYYFDVGDDWNKKTLPENFLYEASSDDVKQENDDSLDSQVDRYLAQYEGDAKPAKNERVDLHWMTREFLSEAAEDDADATDPPKKLTIEDIDVDSFANDVVRLVDNYDSLLEIKSTLLRRAINFLSKTYDQDVVNAFTDVMNEEHSMVAGQTERETKLTNFTAPAADRANDIGGGATG